jgi:hypothetical protein
MRWWAKLHHQALCGSASFEELGEFDLDDFEAELLKLCA